MTEAELDFAVAISDLMDLAEDLGGEVTSEGLIRFADEGDEDAFCDLLFEEFGVVVADTR